VNETMTAVLCSGPREPRRAERVPIPKPGPGQMLSHVCACAVCRTDLHVVDGDLKRTKLPLMPATRSSAAWSRAA